MAEIHIISENELTLKEVEDSLDKIKKRDGELNDRGKKTKDYVKLFTKKKLNEVKDLKAKLAELNIPRLKERHIVKLVDVMPKDADSVKSVLSGESIVVKQEDVERIVGVFK